MMKVKQLITNKQTSLSKLGTATGIPVSTLYMYRSHPETLPLARWERIRKLAEIDVVNVSK